MADCERALHSELAKNREDAQSLRLLQTIPGIGAAAVRLHLRFPCLMLLSERDGNSRTGQIEEAGDGKIARNIQWCGGSAQEQRDAPRVNAEVKFPKSAEAEFPTFRCFGGELARSSVRISFLGHPRFSAGAAER